MEVKEPARAGNNQNNDQQIVRALDHEHKRRYFDLATSIKDAGVGFWGTDSDDSDGSEDEDTTTRCDGSQLQVQQAKEILKLTTSLRWNTVNESWS